jgi:hypothetical protein
MYVCTYVCRKEKEASQHTEKGREGKGTHGMEGKKGNETEN